MKILMNGIFEKISATMSNYQCKKCGTLVQQERTPNSSGCPKGGSHQWYKL